jgi:hypothetical protein
LHDKLGWTFSNLLGLSFSATGAGITAAPKKLGQTETGVKSLRPRSVLALHVHYTSIDFELPQHSPAIELAYDPGSATAKTSCLGFHSWLAW